MLERLKIKEIKYAIEPNVVSLVVTDECTAACTDCCFNCSPRKGTSMTTKEAKLYIQNGFDTFKTLKLVVLTGGEPFLLGINFLSEIIGYANNLKLHTRIVSNAFWANTPKKTANYVNILARAGLNEINFSTGFEHQKYVKANNIVNACIESVKANLTVVVNMEFHGNDNFYSLSFLEDKRYKEFFSNKENACKIKIIKSLWSSSDSKNTTEYDKNEIELLKNINRGCNSILNSYSIFPNGDLMACCGLTVSKIKHLNLGNLKEGNLKSLYENQYRSFINLWLKIDGPYKILEYLSTKETQIKELSVNHMCQACNYLFNNQIVRETVSKYYIEKIPEILFKYQVNKQLKNL
jgi:sulfatase maturation enzyme AslB (radical SAM superfamily)